MEQSFLIVMKKRIQLVPIVKWDTVPEISRTEKEIVFNMNARETMLPGGSKTPLGK